MTDFIDQKEGKTTTIFISYRRSDAAGHAGSLYDRLTHWFDEPVLFFGRESIRCSSANTLI